MPPLNPSVKKCNPPLGTSPFFPTDNGLAPALSLPLWLLHWLIPGSNDLHEPSVRANGEPWESLFTMKSPLGASRGPQDNNDGSQAHSRLACLLRFYGLGLPPAIEANVGHQTKQFMAQYKFDLGPPEMPLLTENVETQWMTTCLYIET